MFFFPTWQHIRSWVGLWWRRRRWQLTDARDGIPSHEQPLLSRKVGMLFLSDNQCILYSTPNLCKFGFGCWFCCPASIFVFVSFLLVFPNMEWCRSVLSRDPFVRLLYKFALFLSFLIITEFDENFVGDCRFVTTPSRWVSTLHISQELWVYHLKNYGIFLPLCCLTRFNFVPELTSLWSCQTKGNQILLCCLMFVRMLTQIFSPLMFNV